MRARDVVMAGVASVVLAGGCRQGAAPEPSPAAPPVQEAPAAAPAEAPAAGSVPAPAEPATAATPSIEVRLNSGNVGGGGPSDQTVFDPGDTVTASVDATTLPPGSIVKASWFDGSGAARGEEHKPPSAGNRWLTFTAPGSNGWAAGSYRVDFLVSTGGFGSVTFQIGQGVQTERPGAVPTLAPG